MAHPPAQPDGLSRPPHVPLDLMMTPIDPQHPLTPDLRSLLTRLRRRIRVYVLLEGLAISLVALAVAFWSTLLIDWCWEPSPTARLVLLALVGIGLVLLVYTTMLRRLFARLGDVSMAVLIERRFDQFHDRLLTLVDPANAYAHDAVHRAMLERTADEAARVARHVRPGRVLDGRPLRRRLALAVGLALSVVLFGWFAHDAFGFWMQRMLLTEARWPRQTRLVVEGFVADGSGKRVEKVARGGDFTVSILADATREAPPPRDVEVRFRWQDGTRGRDAATRIGRAVIGQDAYQPFHYTFKQVTLPLQFDVVGGDDRVDGLRLAMVERPQIVKMAVACDYPAYLRRSPRRLAVAGPIEIPEGTRITLFAVANKRLQQVVLRDTGGAMEKVIDLSTADAPRQFTQSMPPVEHETTLLMTLRDRDGIATRRPYRLILRPKPDAAPAVVVALSGIGTAVTAEVRIPFAGHITDDHGLDRIWIDCAVDARQVESLPCTLDSASGESVALKETVELPQLKTPVPIQPGQRLRLQVKAADRRDLDGGPNIGASQVFLLDVVTADRLHAILESRELMLRRRFETLYGEMTGTRDLLTHLRAAPADHVPASGSSQRPNRPAAGPGNPRPGPATSGHDPSDEQRAERRRLRVVRIQQNVERASHETVDVAGAFGTILQELVNNRIDNEVLRRRLGQGIAEPLRTIGKKMLPHLQQQIGSLHPIGGSDAADPTAVGDAIAQADSILLEMQRVLDRMLELESFHEVLDMLRSMIRDQKALNKATHKERSQALRGLLED